MEPIKIERRGVVEQVIAEIERRILLGEFRPGTALRESRIAPDLGLSRNTVREAIRGLVPLGLVSHVPDRGFLITELGAEGVKDLYRARETIELAAARAPWKALSDAVPALEEAVGQIERASVAGDWGALFFAHRRFHSAFASSIGSTRLQRFLEQIFGELRLAMTQVDRVRQPAKSGAEEHNQLIEVLRSGDRRSLVRELRLHVLRGEQRVCESLSPAQSLEI